MFISLSSPRIISYTNETDITYEAIERASYYLAGGYMLEFNPQVKFKPTVMLINEVLWLGVAHRINDAMGGYVTIKASDALRFGYSYEFNTSNLRVYSSGSHEIFVSYQFKLPRPRCNCPKEFFIDKKLFLSIKFNLFAL